MFKLYIFEEDGLQLVLQTDDFPNQEDLSYVIDAEDSEDIYIVMKGNCFLKAGTYNEFE